MVLDIDFLKKSDWDKNQIYLYKSTEGFLKRNFINSIQVYCKENKLHFRDTSYVEDIKEIFRSTIMGRPFIYINFSTFKKDEAEKIINSIYKKLENDTLKSKILLIPSEKVKDNLEKLENLKRKKICVIEEVNVSRKKKRDKVVDFLIENTDLYDFSKMKNLEIFNQNIYEVLSLCNSVWDLVKKFEYILIMCIKEDMFDIFSAREITNETDIEYFKMYRIVAEVLNGNNILFMDEIYKNVIKDDKVKHGIIQNLYRVMTDFYIVNEFFTCEECPGNYSQYKWNYLKRYKKIKVKHLLIFSSILSKHEVNLKINDFKYYLDVMVKEYCEKIKKLSTLEM
jgi:hypothetical protein